MGRARGCAEPGTWPLVQSNLGLFQGWKLHSAGMGWLPGSLQSLQEQPARVLGSAGGRGMAEIPSREPFYPGPWWGTLEPMP